ncbi:MAG: hypothetical protein ACLR1R_04390 [Ruminococcus callidus]
MASGDFRNQDSGQGTENGGRKKQHRNHNALKSAELPEGIAGTVPELPQCHGNQGIIGSAESGSQTAAHCHRNCQPDIPPQGQAARSAAGFPLLKVQHCQRDRRKQCAARHAAHQIRADLFRSGVPTPQEQSGEDSRTEQKFRHIAGGCHCHAAHRIEVAFQAGTQTAQRQKQCHEPHRMCHGIALQKLLT